MPSDLKWALPELAQLAASPLDPECQRPVVLAFSAGADSTALLLALLEARRRALLRCGVVVAHVDHGLDSQSSARAQRARVVFEALAARYSADPPPQWVVLRENAGHALCGAASQQRDGVEASARAVRYRLLEELRASTESRYVLTAHQIDDQLETLILRIRQGSGWGGLAGIQRQRNRILRPLLSRPIAPTASALRRLLREEEVPWQEDPTNADLQLQRNFVRRRLLPALLPPTQLEQAATSAHRLAERAATVRATMDLRILELLDHRLAPSNLPRSASISLEHWLVLPPALQDTALNALHRSLGGHYGPTKAGRRELRRQLRACSKAVSSSVGCDCGGGWSWRTAAPSSKTRATRLELLAPPSASGD